MCALTESLRTAVDVKMDGWPFDGPSAMDEFRRAVSASGYQFNTFHSSWVKSSGINPKAGAAIEHAVGLTVLHLMTSFDQVSTTNLAGCEQLARRLLMIERATRSNPKNPDYDGLHIYLSNSLDETGGVVTGLFDKWVAQTKSTDATILKQERLWREENANEAKRKAVKGKGKGKDEKGQPIPE